MRVSDILKAKGATVHTVRRDESVAHVAHRLRADGVGAMIVSDNGAMLEGIVSERDIVIGLTEHGGDVLSLKVADLMAKPAVTCAPDDTLAHVAKVMTQRRIRHLPVMEKGKLAGIVSIGDVVKHRMDELEMESNVLRDYAVSRQ